MVSDNTKIGTGLLFLVSILLESSRANLSYVKYHSNTSIMYLGMRLFVSGGVVSL